jgi:hypothetical protein
MYVIREVLNCKPGKVRQMVEKFRSISIVLKEMGQEPLRVLTDVAGEPYWTIVAEARVDKIDDFFAMEQNLMVNETLRKTMADYHDRWRSPWPCTTACHEPGGEAPESRCWCLAELVSYGPVSSRGRWLMAFPPKPLLT